jgi:hypothetical protein
MRGAWPRAWCPKCSRAGGCCSQPPFTARFRVSYDAVTCFFLLHEVPEDMKPRIVQALLGSVGLGGKAVFVDYHRPHPAHPLRPVMQLVFACLEPFAHTLWTRCIPDYAGSHTTQFDWHKETLFGGLYQIVVATRRGD